ncbi:hypothetical protein RJ641_005174 [Dillenia turbinata]|uniref:Protein FLX-like 2 n=1 Tax=Dillenia turbinata TaxID=194707 RepID=A0AAN8VCB7_9MAGN
MGSKGRVPPPYLRRPLPGPDMVHPDPYGPGVRPAPGAFPPFDMLPPPEIMEQKLAVQHGEMQTLATENQRLAATHRTLRQELAGAQHELQILQAQIGAVKSEREQQMRGLMDKIAKMEAELKTAEPVKLELQKAQAEAQNLVVMRQELISKVQQLTQDLQRAHTDVQQIPPLIAELESLRLEYQHCRATYDYEKKLYNDHLESLQVMEKNYMNMAREVEKLRAELTNTANIERRAGGPYGAAAGYNENEDSVHHPAGQNSFEDGYGAPQGRAPVGGGAASGANVGGPATPKYAGTQPGAAVPRANYDSSRGPGYGAQRGLGYDQRAPSYDRQWGPGYDAQRGAAFDSQRGAGYDLQRGPGYDAQRTGPAYDAQRGPGYDAQTRGPTGPHGQVPPVSSAPYGSATPPARAGGGYEAPSQAGNPIRR